MGFRSKLEEQVSDLLLELGVDQEYESSKITYTLEKTYTPDFFLPNKHLYLEVKGYWSPEDRRKQLEVRKQNPDLDIRMVFQSPFNKISKRSKTTYAKFCDKKNILWTAWHNIPIEWLT